MGAAGREMRMRMQMRHIARISRRRVAIRSPRRTQLQNEMYNFTLTDPVNESLKFIDFIPSSAVVRVAPYRVPKGTFTPKLYFEQANKYTIKRGLASLVENVNKQQANPRSHCDQMSVLNKLCAVLFTVLLAIVAVILPPLAVLLVAGCGTDICINILLTLLGWIPGTTHAHREREKHYSCV